MICKLLQKSLNLSKNFSIKIVVASYHVVTMESNNDQTITEGLAEVKTFGHVFYNPVQEFNRDLSISVLSVFSKEFTPNLKQEKQQCKKSEKNNVAVIINKKEQKPAGVQCENGITILEALSASGLRSIRYAKEVPGVKTIVANDLSKKAVESIKANVETNSVENIVEPNFSDAIECMYAHRHHGKQFEAIDLDPYGCPSIFLDSAVQAIIDGGLLLVTATDMAVLAGNSPETCHVKYGSVSLRMKACHEMALRILLRCIEARANVYGRYIVPLLSVSADFYIRVFVKVFSGPNKCKHTTSKLSNVYHCTGCGSFTLQPLGIIKSLPTDKQVKFGLPTGPAVNSQCEHCGQKHHMGGPIWSAPIHDRDFVQKVLNGAPERLNTWKRIQGVLTVILEELEDVPLYYTLEHLSSMVRCETPPMLLVRSAILNAGYRVSYTHTNKTSIKTDAPTSFLWDVMRAWEAEHPVKRERLTPAGAQILSKPASVEIDFATHVNAKPPSVRQCLVRFQENPKSYWGPGTRATNMMDDKKVSKKQKNQNKRKRNESSELNKEDCKKMETETVHDV